MVHPQQPICSTHRVWSMHLLRVPPDHTHTCTQSNHITSSLYNSTILHTKTTRQRHIYVKKTVGEWWGMWGGGKWGWMFARETLSSDWRTLSKKLWATLLCHPQEEEGGEGAVWCLVNNQTLLTCIESRSAYLLSSCAILCPNQNT